MGNVHCYLGDQRRGLLYLGAGTLEPSRKSIVRLSSSITGKAC
jgi:hypothetical protein